MKQIFPVLFLVFGSCAYHVKENMQPVLNPNPIDSVGSTYTYTKDVQPIMITYCYGKGDQRCHVVNTNQGAPGNFSTYAGLKSKLDAGLIASRVFNPSGGMPASYSNSPRTMAQADLQILKDWVAEGAPEN